MIGLFAFDRRRWWAFGILLGSICFLTFLGGWFMVMVPFLGGFLFLARLMLYFVPGVVFAWTGLFEFHEFGASPTGWPGYVVMLAFYAVLALLMSWPFGRTRPKPPWTLGRVSGSAPCARDSGSRRRPRR
jgi:hypothetical protein